MQSLSDESGCLSRTTVGDLEQFAFGVDDNSHVRCKVSNRKAKRKAIKREMFEYTEKMTKSLVRFCGTSGLYAHYKISSSKHLG